MGSPYARQSPAQEDVPQRRSRFSGNAWTLATILGLLGPGSFSFLDLAFLDLRRSTRNPDSSPALNKVAWVIFAVVCVTGTVGFLFHAMFAF